MQYQLEKVLHEDMLPPPALRYMLLPGYWPTRSELQEILGQDDYLQNPGAAIEREEI